MSIKDFKNHKSIHFNIDWQTDKHTNIYMLLVSTTTDFYPTMKEIVDEYSDNSYA